MSSTDGYLFHTMVQSLFHLPLDQYHQDVLPLTFFSTIASSLPEHRLTGQKLPPPPKKKPLKDWNLVEKLDKYHFLTSDQQIYNSIENGKCKRAGS